ncbi:AimR family lysis-lysogeny pheromone receptor [Bacillus subtilis]|uniref:AimR family lysis-lysogeny pheromone receptor n=1 Tax=Bacillus subtilis TaxID=1423 RepID=UPI0039F02046
MMEHYTNLAREVKCLLEDEKIKMSDILRSTNHKNANCLYDFVNGKREVLKDFENTIGIARCSFPDTYEDYLEDFVYSIADREPNRMVIVEAMEWADASQRSELTDFLVDKLKNCRNLKCKEYGNVYFLHRQLTKGEITAHEALVASGKLGLKQMETVVFSRLMVLYKYLELRQFDTLSDMAKDIHSELVEKDSFISKSYSSRIQTLLANMSLTQGDLVNTRKHAELAISESDNPRFLAFGYLHLGNSYLFESYEKSKEKLLLGMECAKNHPERFKQLRRSMVFLDNYWNKGKTYLNHESNETEDIQGIIYNHIQNGRNEAALDMLQKLEDQKQNDNLKGYHYYFKGLIDGNIANFYLSAKHFKLSGDKFCVTLPLVELQKHGENAQLLELLTI